MIETIETFVTALFAGLALLASAGFIVFRQPVYAAVSFAATVLSASVLYIMLSAAYIAAATMVIYAGATIIIFLFVLMFAQHSNLQQYELKYSNLAPAIVASVALVLLLGYAISTRTTLTRASLICHSLRKRPRRLPMFPRPVCQRPMCPQTCCQRRQANRRKLRRRLVCLGPICRSSAWTRTLHSISLDD